MLRLLTDNFSILFTCEWSQERQGETGKEGGRRSKAGYFLLGHAAYELHTQKYE